MPRTTVAAELPYPDADMSPEDSPHLKWLEKALRRAGFDEKQKFAKKIGISRESLSHKTRGGRSWTEGELEKAASALNVTLRELREGLRVGDDGFCPKVERGVVGEVGAEIVSVTTGRRETKRQVPYTNGLRPYSGARFDTKLPWAHTARFFVDPEDDDAGGIPGDCRGRLCVVKDAAGDRELRVLAVGSEADTWALVCPATGKVLEDNVVLQGAAPVILVVFA